jgi:transcriptional regulator with XRE-family HTH domain
MKEILIKLRQENRYSQSLLSKVLGISRQAYMKYESGEVEPSVEIVRKLSKIYKVPYDVLIDNKVQKEQKKFYMVFQKKKV